MNFMQYITGNLERKMMDDWAKIPEDGRPNFRTWAKTKTEEILKEHYGI